VANFYYAAIKNGLWEKICAALVEKVCAAAGRKATPSYAIINSQSVETVSAAEERSIDGGKNERTQVDIIGNMLAVVVVQAAISMIQSRAS